MKELAEDIKNKSLKNVYLLYGPENYLRSQYKHKLMDAAVDSSDKMNRAEFDGKNVNIRELIDLADTVPFFAEKRVIALTGSGFFKGAAEDELVEYMSEIPVDTVIIFDEDEVDRRSRMYKAVLKNGYCAELDTPDEKQLRKWIAGILSRSSKKIRARDLDLLIERVGTDMQNLKSELDKLISYTGNADEVTEQDIRAICSVHIDNTVFELLDAIIDGNRQEAMRLYDAMLKLKEPPLKILRLLSRQFEMLYQTKQLSTYASDRNAVGKVIGVPPLIAGKYISRATRLSLKFLRSAIENCTETDYNIKSGRMSDILGVELLIVKSIIAIRKFGSQ